MGRLNKLTILVLILAAVAWHRFSYRASNDVSENYVLDFEYEPTERFNLDSKWSWAFTALVVVIASSYIAL